MPEQRRGSKLVSERWKLGLGGTRDSRSRWVTRHFGGMPASSRAMCPSDTHDHQLASSMTVGALVKDAGSITPNLKCWGFCATSRGPFFSPPSFPSLCILGRSRTDYTSAFFMALTPHQPSWLARGSQHRCRHLLGVSPSFLSISSV